jgi:asparagine synthase (glutamine-hydrolysing)
MTFPDYSRILKELLYESVEMRMISDVPLGAFLSGGIDSTVITAIMKDLQKGPVKTFSIGYDVGGRDYDDLYYADLVSRRFKTDHTKYTVTAGDILSSLPHIIEFMDQPSMDAINSYFVSRLASKEVRVALSGTGGDELFAGYQTTSYILDFLKQERFWDKIPSFLRGTFQSLFCALPDNLKDNRISSRIERFLHRYGSFEKKYGAIRMEFLEKDKERLYSSLFSKLIGKEDTHSFYHSLCSNLDEHLNPINKVSYLDLKTYLGTLFMPDIDMMSMAFSLETRLPLIDHKLVEFAASIPPQYKLYQNRTKYIFIEAVKELLPQEVIDRPKLGFAFPFPLWLKSTLKPLVEFVFKTEHIEERGFFMPESVEYFKKRFYTDVNSNYRKVWGMVILELWLRYHHDKDYTFFDRLKEYIESSG